MTANKLKGPTGVKVLTDGILRNHPISSMTLGICSALAVSNTIANAIAMGAGVLFVLLATALFISALRSLIPARVRIITYMIVIASFVIIVDRFLKAYFPAISESIGPYVGLIITNCIIMGRAEAFYTQNPIRLSILDAVGNGLGYAYTLILVAVVREFLGFGTLLGIKVTPSGWENWLLMSMAPGAFFLIGVFLWISRSSTAGSQS